MPKFYVRYVHEVEITYEATVYADSEEEARENMENGIFESEEELEWQGMRMRIYDVEEAEPGDE